MELIAWAMTTPYGQYIVAGFAILGGLVTIASAIVPLTKTPKDDEFVGKVKAFIDRFSLFEPKAK
jgi:hypothetical protein